MDQEVFQKQLEKVAGKLLYPSETDMPLKVHRLEAGRFHDAPPSPEAILSQFFLGKKPESLVYERMDGPYSVGYRNFFRYLTDYITCHSPGSFTLRTPAERENALLWRQFRDLWMDNLVEQQWFKASLPDGVRKRIYIVGQFLETGFHAETNAWDIRHGDWFFIETETVET